MCYIYKCLSYGVYYKFLYEENKEYKDYKEYKGYFGVGTESFTKNYSNGEEIKVGPGWEFSSNDGYVTSYKKKKNKYMLNLKNVVVVQSGIDLIYK